MSFQPEITTRTWSEFLSLLTPEEDYNHFFAWLTKRVQRLPQYKVHNLPDYNGYVYADDIVSDSTLKILNAMRRGVKLDKEKFPNYALTVAKNLLIDRIRRRTKEVATLNSTRFILLSSRTEQSQFHFDSGDATISVLMWAVSNLSMDDVRILDFVLNHGEFNSREIAETLNISEVSARKRLSRLRHRLKKTIFEERSAKLHARVPQQLSFSSSKDKQKILANAHSSGVSVFGPSSLAKTVMPFSASFPACKKCKAGAQVSDLQVVGTTLSGNNKRTDYVELGAQVSSN